MGKQKKYRRIYRVQYLRDGVDRVNSNVVTTDGYTMFGDIPRILAVRDFSSNSKETVERIEVVSAELISKTEAEE